MNKHPFPATLLTDFYKLFHREQYPEGTEYVYSTWTPRSNKYFPESDEVVVFGIQAFVKKYLIEYFTEHFFNRPKKDILNEYERFVRHTLDHETVDTSHLRDLHDLGYLPIKLKALKEGTLAPIQTPILTIENTHPKFFWLTNYLETIISNEIWLPMTSATTSYQYRKILNEYAIKTTGSTAGVEFQGHDFSMRGLASFDASKVSGAAHLLSFVGTDMIPSILYHEEFYDADIETELVGTSIYATEHSVMCANTSPDGDRDEYDMFKRLITEIYPSGMVSVVSDSYDFWKVIGETLPRLKDEIMSRDGRVVIRPDSGIPEDVLCGINIPDLTNPDYPNEKPEHVSDYFTDKLQDMDIYGDGYTGNDSYTFEFKLHNKYYRMKMNVEYDRHDKRHYYIDSTELAFVEEFTPTNEELGLVESLWNLFGGTVNEQGYKVLDSHIGAIYGDSITLERATTIVKRLAEKGFASTNVVLGLGSYSFQMKTRDSFGFAMKATHAVVNGEERELFKDPKADQSKRSQRGLVTVFEDELGNIVSQDGLNREDQKMAECVDMLETVFEDGILVRNESLKEIRELLHDGEFQSK